ncbi:MAG: sugar transferase [Clostridiaceae bacterium]|nr:sugar transferase [Clostridiaceae bacterium]
MLHISVTLTSVIIFGEQKPETNKAFILLIVIINLTLCFFHPFYENYYQRGYLIELKSVVLQIIVVYGFAIIFLYMIKDSAEFSRRITGYSLFLSMFLIYIYRSIFKKWLKPLHVEYQNERNIVIVSDTYENTEIIIEKLKQISLIPYKIVGVCCISQDDRKHEIKYMTSLDMLRDFLISEVVDEIIISRHVAEKVDLAVVRDIVNMGIILHLEIDKYINYLPNTRLNEKSDVAFLTSSFGVVTKRQVIFKRILDIVGGIVGLLIMSLAFLIFAPIIFLQSPGPIFFTQKRVGKNGRLFKIYKFRTMYLDAEERKAELMKLNKIDSGLMFKIEDDPRIIPIGKFLRKMSIDELPQFINVLKGEMSLVGTRPPTVDEFQKYKSHHKLRLSIKPGITGNWQISGRSDITDFEEVVALDTDYIDNWTLSKDIKILFKTILLLFKRDGAY